MAEKSEKTVTQQIEALESPKQESDVSEKKPKPEYLWKLVKPKYMLTFRLCDECNGKLYNNPIVTQRHGPKVEVKFDMCQQCVETNCRATDVLAPPKNKKN